MKEKILIVEDQFIEANNLQMILERANYQVCSIARSVPVALKIIDDEKPDIVLLDIYLQGPQTGIDLAHILRQKNIAFIYLSANSNTETLEAAKATCPYGFLVKPFREKDVLVTLEIAQYLHKHSLESIIRTNPSDTDNTTTPQRTVPTADTHTDIQGIVGQSKPIQGVLKYLRMVAPSDTSVLILGESGTGKERIAENIHRLSARKHKPIIRVNCAALPATLIESHLFGHERGAFTGATERRLGKFEQAHDGTIFLDEIGELPLEVQVKFLRVLQEKEIERIGGNTTIKVNVRIIAATNRNLEKEVAEGRFRMDLYYRLNVFPLILPPLRERREDIPLLANHFMRHYSQTIGKNITTIAPAIRQDMEHYHWPGNIRELEHAIERAVLLAQSDTLTDLPLPIFHTPTPDNRIKTIEEIERDYILSILTQCNGKISGPGGAAELLGLNVSTLNSKLKKLQITPQKTSTT